MPFINDTEYFDFLKDKRVVVVGPARSAEGKRQGSLIDSYDVVVRIKSRFVAEDRKDDLGARGDILYTDDHEANDIVPGDTVVTGDRPDKQIIAEVSQDAPELINFKYTCSVYPQGEWFFNRFTSSLQYLSQLGKVRVINDQPYLSIKEKTNRPNAGFSAVIDLLTTPLAELYITGIDFYRSLYRGSYLNSKWNKDTVKRMASDPDGVDPRTGKPDFHDPDAQFKYFKYEMYAKDKRIKVDEFLYEALNNPIYEKYENIL